MKRWVNRASCVLAVSMVSACFGQTGAGQAGSTPPAKTTAEPKKEKQPLYDEKADAKQQIATALKAAKKNNRRVLIQWGGNWCGWCIKLHELCMKDAAIKKKLQYEYDVVHIDSAGPEKKNMDLAKSYGAELPEKGFPYLTVLDADGKVIANQETGALEIKAKEGEDVVMAHDPKAVLDFLAKHQAAYPEASKVLADGVALAKAQGKLVFLHFGAPWCGWCHRLEDWMDRADVAPILAKQFVDVKIDVDRTIGGNSVFTEYAGSDKVGIPWFAFVGGDGKAAADSYAEKKQNVGFPAAPEELAHFEAMLNNAATKLSDADKKTLLELLRTDKAKGKNAGH